MNNTTPIVPVPTKKGSGRTKGSFSFVKIPLKDLMAKFADPNTQVVVGRKWAEACGFDGLVSNPATTTMASIEGVTPATHVNVVVSELED